MLVEDGLPDGQHVKCPFCGETTCYSKPARIALPTSGPKQAASEAAPQDDVPTVKPKLAIRRPNASSSGRNPSDNAFVQGVRDRVKAESRRKFWNGVRTKCGNLVSIAVMLGILFGGWKAYRYLTGDGRDGDDRSDQTTPRGDAAPADSGRPGGLSGPGQDDRGKEPKGETGDGFEEELAMPSDFKRVSGRFERAAVSYWGKLKPSERPGAAAGTFSLWVPFGKSVSRYYEILSSPTGVVSVVFYDEAKHKRRVSVAEYEKLVADHGGFIARDGVAYYVTAKGMSKTWMPPLRSGEAFEPGVSYFGFAEAFIRKSRMKADGVAFDVLWSLNEGDEPLKVGEANLGGKVYFSQFKKAVENLARSCREKELGDRPKGKTYRPSIVLYDGAAISSGVDGVTRVPRTAPRHAGTGYDRWVRLRNEALSQEAKLQDVALENKRAQTEWQRKMDAPVTDMEAGRLLAAGNVRLKRK